MQVAIITLISLVLALLIVLIAFVIKKSGSAAAQASLRTLCEQKDIQIEELNARVKTFDELQRENARLQAALENEKKTAQEKLGLLQEAETRLKTEFENLANRIFEEKGQSFTKQSNERLGSLLHPFREQIEAFRKRIEEVHKNDAEGLVRLLEQVRQLQETSSQVSQTANNLAVAIKGDAKTQGNWGELIVERIFEASGLERGREWEAQAGMRAADGRLLKPDFVVFLPGAKAVIVDAKVSLTAYERYCSETDASQKQAALADHSISVRKHIDELNAKEYHTLLGNRTLDFVIMCIPVEGAYQLALQEDKNLLYDLARGNVVLTGPATLMLTLKLIAQIWRRENENRNVERIADRAGRLYDQVALVLEAMLDAQKRLAGVAESFDTALRRLKEGKGNLVGRVEEIRRLGAKTSKQIPQEMVEEAGNDTIIE
ncbi:MAG: DNA recombination protein RmuC [Chitinispirillaceae bacterium]|nr:DNA recombination protein RmuC [Chitinispirillaceae bacterium]